jgi:type VI secretion system FHA domain protein
MSQISNDFELGETTNPSHAANSLGKSSIEQMELWSRLPEQGNRFVILILEVTSPQPTKLGGASRRTFHAEGGSIGRDNDNSWVLSHAKVSGHHAVITYRNAVYYIEDTSRNGVCLNSSKDRLVRGRPYALKSGDRILIDPYEIRVSITHDQNDAPERNPGGLSDLWSSNVQVDSSNPFDTDDPFAPGPIPSSGLESPAESVPDHGLDPLELLNLVPKRVPVRQAPSARDLERGSPADVHFQPPAVMPIPPSGPRADAVTIPQGYDPLAPDDSPSIPVPSWPAPPPDERMTGRPLQERATPLPVAPAPLPVAPAPPPIAPAPLPIALAPAALPIVPAPAALPIVPAPLPIAPSQMSPETENSQEVRDRAPVPASTEHPVAADFAAVLAGAGLDPANVTPELARGFGQILRVVVSGVMDVMQSRQQIKDEFRMSMTRVRPAENNPLKFSVNVDDALHNLLVKRNPAYLAPVEAFEDAFVDLRHHQIAMLAGMRVAFESMLAEFDPDRLQQEFDRQLNKGLVPAKLRYWDLYRERRRDIVKDPEASFRRLFGEEFARAYEDQLKQLKAQESSARGASSRTPKQPGT